MKRGTIVGLLIYALLIALASTSQAFAGPENNVDKYWYAGFGLTASKVSFNETNLSIIHTGSPGATFENSGNAFKLFAGYQFDSLLGVEFGATSFGEVVMKNGLVKTNLFTASGGYLSATATQAISGNIDAIGKLGMFMWSLDDTGSESIEEGQGIVYGVGLDINIYKGKERSLLIEWEHYSFSDVAIKEANSLGVSLKFRFY